MECFQTDNEAAQVLLQQLAWKDANEDCQALLSGVGLQARGIHEFIRMCQNVGTETHKAEILAIMKPSPASHACFKCGNPGHMQKDCHQQTRGQTNKLPNKDCWKGKHWANQCQSKFDKEGQPLLGNEERGVSSHAPNPKWSKTIQNPIPQVFLNQVKDGLQICKKPPQEVQDWTYTLPQN